MPISIGHYLNNMSKLTDQWTRENFKEPDRQRIYLKDIDCPAIWHDKLKEQIPSSVFYLNESTGEYGGPGLEGRHEQGAARAGDLMSCLPPTMRADNMMCYIGHEGTYTPAHREMCASLGQNLMVETSDIRREDGRPAKPGSSIWFMTETKDRHLVSEYWLSTLGHDIEVESHFAQINAWKAAPFKTYIVDQRVGDFILIPPLAPHQVWNRGTRTMKAAWNRTTVETLEMALHEALPRARMVCRDEQYKNKSIIYFALDKYYAQLKQVQVQKRSRNAQVRHELGHSLKIRQLQKDFKRLFALYTEILLSEMLDPVSKTEKKGQYLPYDSFVTCSYCRSNIFNRFLTCTSCITELDNGDDDTYDICMDCYAMGRSCSCISKYKWVEQFPWNDLISKHDSWRHLIIDFEGGVNEKSPLSLEMERKSLSKKTLAQVCQEQLKARPFVDPKKPKPVISAYERRHPGFAKSKTNQDQDVNVDDEGNVKKSTSRKTRAEKLPAGWVIEHVSCHPEVKWMVASCCKCDRNYSYGSMFRMFDLMPQTIMENPEWECPACLRICSCGACRKKGDTKPYEPTGTVLGHDTKKVADPRSVDSLVNFNLPNLGWIKRTGDDHPLESKRLSRRRDEAERAKSNDPTLDDNYVDEDEETLPILGQPSDSETRYNVETELAIDPMLLMDDSAVRSATMVNNQRTNDEVTRAPPRRHSGEGLGPYQEQNRNSAPIANMMRQHDHIQGFTSNGIAYEYPDPTVSQSSSTFHMQDFAQPDIGSSMRRRLEESTSQTNFVAPPENRMNGQQLTQLEQMLEDAKLCDRFISTEARITGKSRLVILSIPGSKLAAIVNRPPAPSMIKTSTTGARFRAPEILQSDFPPAIRSEQSSVPKKRKAKQEKDDDFTARKRGDRMSPPAVVPISAKDTRKKTVKYTEPSSESETEEATSFMPVNTTRKHRGSGGLPKHMNQRTKEDVPSSPATLVGMSSKSTPQIHKQSGSNQTPALSSVRNHQGSRSSSTKPLRSVAFATPNETKSVQDSAATLGSDDHDDEDVVMSESPAVGISGFDSALSSLHDDPQEEEQASTPALSPKPIQERKKSNLKNTPPLDPALKLAEDNRKAKMKAMQWAESDGGASSDSDPSSIDGSPIKASKPAGKPIGKPTATPKSIFSRAGQNGKKIKIVGVKGGPVNGKAARRAVDIAKRSLKAL